MNKLRQFLDSIEHHFLTGGKWHKFYSLYEAIDTIFYMPNKTAGDSVHVRDGIDLKRIMISVWAATFPAMFFGMWNIGYQANTYIADLAAQGLTFEGDWHHALIALLAGHNPDSLWDNFIYGASYFVPIYLVTFVVGGFWEVLFATVRRHEINEGFFCHFCIVCTDVSA